MAENVVCVFLNTKVYHCTQEREDICVYNVIQTKLNVASVETIIIMHTNE